MSTQENVKRNRKKYIVALSILLLLVCAVLGGGFYFYYKIDVPCTEFIVELGEGMETELKNFATGTDFALAHTQVDFNKVDLTSIGTYEFTIRHAWQNFPCTVTVRDTTEPTLALRIDSVVLELGETYDAQTFVEKAWDLGGEVSVSFLTTETDSDSYLAEQLGKNNITLQAVDPSGNTSRETIEVTVQDTTEPTLVLRTGTIVLVQGQTYDTQTFVETAWDLGGEVTVHFSLHGKKDSDFYLAEQLGRNIVFIQAVDPSGNTMLKSLNVIVDAPPEFGSLREYYVALGYDVDFKEFITAYDKVDGDVTDSIRMDRSALNLSKTGEGVVRYSVTDSYGLTAETETAVHVYSREDLQHLINTHVINRIDQIIVGAYDLYDGGIYEEKDVDYALEQLRPAIVRLEKRAKRITYSGSGFIVRITEDEIILCTNRHVVRDFDKMDVYFYDGTYRTGTVLGRMGIDAGETDVALVSVKRENVPQELFDTLKSIHFNMGYWQDLDQNPQTKVGILCINERGGTWVDKRGVILTKETLIKDYESYGIFTETNIVLEHGMSGSALVDGYGNLVGMAVSATTTTDNKRQYWCVTLEHIAECFEAITGQKLYYE